MASPPSKLSLRNFHIVGMIADGSYSEVYEAVNLRNNRKVAIKKIYKDTITQHFKHLEIYVERYVMKTFSAQHKGIIKFLGSFQDKEFLYFVTEYCPYGDLGLIILELHQTYAKSSEKQELEFLIRCYVYQIASTIAFLHSRGLAHLDIKPKNIVVDSHFNLRLIDFATCHFFQTENQPDELREQMRKHHVRKSSQQKIKYSQPGQETAPRAHFVGTPEYVSPEMLNNSAASFQADYWALGCIIYEIYYGRQPFTAQSEQAIFNNILQLRYSMAENGAPKDAQDLIRSLLILKPEEREANVLAHPYFDVVRARNYRPWESEVPLTAEVRPLFQELMAKQSMQSIIWGVQPPIKDETKLQRRSRLRTIIEELDDQASSPFQPNRKIIKNQLAQLRIEKTESSEEYIAWNKSLGFITIQRDGWCCWPILALLIGYQKPPSLILDVIRGEKRELKMDPSVVCRKEGKGYVLQSQTYYYRFRDLEARPIDWDVIVSIIKKEYIKSILG